MQALIDSGSIQNLSTVQINAAYQAGLDARNSLNTRRDTDGLHLRQSSIWENGANSTADVQEVEANAEQDQKRNADSGRKTAAEKAAGFTAGKAYRRVKTLEELGVKDAKAGIKVTQVSSDYSDETARAYEMCAQNGVNCIFFTGGYLQTKDGIIARGANKGGVVYIRADDPNFTANEIAGHEIGHELVNRGSLDMNAVISEVRKEYTKEELSKIVDDYGLDFLADGVNEDELADIAIEEITCDALGGMNAFASNMEGNAEFIQKLQGLAEKHYTGKTGEGTDTRQKGAEQIKRIDNINQTLNPDTRYSTVSHISDYAWAEENGIINYDDIRVIDEVAEKYMRYHSDVRKIGDEHFYADLGKKIVVMHEIDDHCEIDYVFTSDKSIEKVDIQKIGGYLTNVRTGSRASRIAQSILKTANLRVYAAEDSRQVPYYRNGRGSRKTSIRDYLEDQERRDFLEDSGEFEHKFSTVNSTQLALENPDVYDEIQVTFDEILQKTKGKDLEAALMEEAQKHREDLQMWEHEAAVLTKLWKQSEKNEVKLAKALSEHRDRVSEVSEELRERRRDVRTMENEFVRVVREWEKQTGKLEGKTKESASL